MALISEPGLVEREHELETLDASLTQAAGGHGGVVLVHGEAGIGKTSLVRTFCDEHADGATVLWGVCDELFTPRPLGPLLDMAETARGDVAATVGAGATPYEVSLALERWLAERAPGIAVFEDMHLADEATLDVLRLLARRVEDRPLLLVATYRDDGLDRWHPLRQVLGEIAATSEVTRLRLARLSADSVFQLAAESRLAGEVLYRRTAGNPFFVTEALRAGDDVPETVRDVVLGRAARLSDAGRALLEVVAVSRQSTELWLLEALAGEDVAALDEACASGMVSSDARGVAFSHELARHAIEEEMPLMRRSHLHRRALALLSDPPVGEPDPARLAHHADAIGDGHLVLEHAPRAAERAALLGAHREAAAHFRQALRFAGDAPAEVRAALAEYCARESYLIVEFEHAVAEQREALRCFEELGDRRRQGAVTGFLAQLLWQAGSLPEALETVERALALLDDLPGPELVNARCERARLAMAAEDPDSALRWAASALELAGELDNPEARVAAMQTLGWTEYFAGRPGGLERILESAALAQAEGVWFFVSTAYVVIVRTACRRREYTVAAPFLEQGLEFCSVGDLDIWRYYLLSWQAKILLYQGQWSQAAKIAQICLGHDCPFARIHALVALGLVRARRGDPGAWEPLDEALALAAPRHELQWIAPVAAARAEAAFLEGRPQDAIAETEACWDFAQGTWYAAGLAYWRRRAGLDEATPELGEEQYRLELDGRWREAADRWRDVGCGYDAAFATLASDDETELRGALDELRALGAGPAVRLATARLHELGARGVPRGPHASTRENPASLTARELEVLSLVARGLRNAEIAEQLFITEKTAAHHVSAILRKLGAANRAQATSEAVRLGISHPH